VLLLSMQVYTCLCKTITDATAEEQSEARRNGPWPQLCTIKRGSVAKRDCEVSSVAMAAPMSACTMVLSMQLLSNKS